MLWTGAARHLHLSPEVLLIIPSCYLDNKFLAFYTRKIPFSLRKTLSNIYICVCVCVSLTMNFVNMLATLLFFETNMRETIER
jgi:hypothetical protein